jgi:hypothetical protein
MKLTKVFIEKKNVLSRGWKFLKSNARD